MATPRRRLLPLAYASRRLVSTPSSEVESALVEHPAVAEAAVVAKPDPLRGQIVKAYVVLAPGHQGSEGLVAELQEHCRTVTAAYKYPREIEFTLQLPKTISGKIRRVELRQRELQRGV